MTNLDPYSRMIQSLSGRVDTKPVFRWATVTQTKPLLIQLDGDPAPLLGSPSNAGPKVYLVGERVRVEIQNGRATVHTAANRYQDARGTSAQRVALAMSGDAGLGMRFYDEDEGREYVWSGAVWVASGARLEFFQTASQTAGNAFVKLIPGTPVRNDGYTVSGSNINVPADGWYLVTGSVMQNAITSTVTTGIGESNITNHADMLDGAYKSAAPTNANFHRLTYSAPVYLEASKTYSFWVFANTAGVIIGGVDGSNLYRTRLTITHLG